jgi:hypothetical protein
MILLMQSAKYLSSLTYIEGSALVEADLKRVKLEEADAIFIMTNKFSDKPDEEDAKTILVSLSMKRYMLSVVGSSPLFCMQLIRPQNLRHLNRSDDPDESASSSQLVVCINQIKMGILAKGVMFPGATTLIMNLISSFNDVRVGLWPCYRINLLQYRFNCRIMMRMWMTMRMRMSFLKEGDREKTAPLSRERRIG